MDGANLHFVKVQGKKNKERKKFASGNKSSANARTHFWASWAFRG
jgi:hypothetical protein